MNDRYISSAKKLYVTIITISLSITYLGWLEKAGNERYMIFAYIETLLHVQSSLTRGFDSGYIAVGADVDKVDFDYARQSLKLTSELLGLKLQSNLNEDELKSSEQYKEIQEAINKRSAAEELVLPNSRTFSGLALRSDPSRECGFMVTRGDEQSASELQIFTPLKNHFVSSAEIFFVQLFWRCRGVELEKLQSVFVDRRKEQDQWYVELPESAFEELDLLGDIERASYKLHHLRPDVREYVGAFFEKFPDQFENMSDEQLVTGTYFVPFSRIESKVLAESYRMTGKLYTPEEINQAMTDVLSRDRTGKTILGVTGPIEVIVGCSPIFLFGMLFTIWHRLRRIVVDRTRINEPWVLIDARGRIEEIFRFTWAAALPLSIIGSWWAVFEFARAQLPTFQWLLSIFASFEYGLAVGVRTYVTSISFVASAGSLLMILNMILVGIIFFHIRRISRELRWVA